MRGSLPEPRAPTVRKVRAFGLALAAAVAATGLLQPEPHQRHVAALAAAWAGAMFILLTRVPRPAGWRRGDTVELRTGFGQRWLLAPAFFAPLLGMAGLGLVHPGSQRPVAAAALAALLGGLALAIAAAHERFEVGPAGIARVVPWPFSRRTVPWSRVIGLREAAHRGRWRLVVLDGGGRALSIDEDMDGIGDFAALALRHVAPGALDAQPGLRRRLEALAARAAADRARRGGPGSGPV